MSYLGKKLDEILQKTKELTQIASVLKTYDGALNGSIAENTLCNQWMLPPGTPSYISPDGDFCLYMPLGGDEDYCRVMSAFHKVQNQEDRKSVV